MELPENVFSDLPLPAWLSRADGTFEIANASFLTQSGAATDRLRDEGWHWMVHPADLSSTVEAWNIALSTGEPFS
ncbi:MAG TPA: hypothetical protein VF614_07020, partial [Chthoniobacteraceae bacterium]